MTRTKEADIYVARSSGVMKIDGTLYTYFRGQAFPAGHPLIHAKPESFVPQTFERVEQATAAPGEKRGAA